SSCRCADAGHSRRRPRPSEDGCRSSMAGPITGVMAGLVPAIHVFVTLAKQDVDARDKRGQYSREDRGMFRGLRARTFAVAAALTALLGTAHAQTAAEIVNYRGPDREQKLIEGARKEGQVVLYSALIVNQMLRPLAAGFMKKYPFIKMTYYRADSEEL